MSKQKFIDQLSCKISVIEKKKKKKKKPTDSHFSFFRVKFVSGYPCVRHYILYEEAEIHRSAIMQDFRDREKKKKKKKTDRQPF